MITNDFYGRKQFIWWTGVVEDVLDPLEIGSVRVRIIGLHSENKNLVPTDTLPWAQVLLPTTGAKTTSGVREGDWVFGFFQDGEYAQIPVVIGMFPGIQGIQSQIVYSESKRIKTNPPRISADIVIRKVDEPTPARLARGILDGTLVNRTNNQLVGVCDISADVRLALFEVKQAFGPILEWIREKIKALIASLGLEPSGELRKVIQFLKDTAAQIRKVISWYEKNIKPYIELMIKVVKLIRGMIDYILSLPERLKKFIAQCLQEIIKSITTEVKSFVAGVGSESSIKLDSDSDLKDLIKETNNVINASQDLLKTAASAAAAPAQLVGAFVNPNNSIQSLADFEKAASDIDSYVKTSFEGPESVQEKLIKDGSKGP
jgi:hypothetical protein